MTKPRLSQIAQTGATAWQVPVWNATTGQWEPGSASVAGALLAANNLSDLAAPVSARTNLGLGTAATKNTGTTSGTIPILGATNTVPLTVIGMGVPTAGQYVDGGTGAWTNIAATVKAEGLVEDGVTPPVQLTTEDATDYLYQG